MTPSTEHWLSQRLHEGADTLQVPHDLTDVVVGQTIEPQPRRKRIHSVMQVAAAVTAMAVVVVGVSVLRNNDTQMPTPATSPTPNNTTAPVTDPATALLGTWELVSWEGEPFPAPRHSGPLVTFETNGTWSASYGCNRPDGTYVVGPDGLFESTTREGSWGGCISEDGIDLLPVPADDAVQVTVDNDTATFLDASDEQVAKYRRPGGAVAAEARLVTRLGDPALALSTYGSGSCPTRIESIVVEANNQLVVTLADSSGQVCTLDLTRSTDVMTIPDGLDLGAPITARLMGTGPPITLLVDSSALVGEPKLVTARGWDGSSVELARLEGILGVNEQGCVTVGDTVVMWPNTYYLGQERAGTWVIVTGDEDQGPGYGTVLATEGERVVLAGGMTPFDVSPGPLPVATHSKCLLDDDYWTGIIEVPADG